MFSWNQLHPGVKAIFFVQIVNRLGDFVVPFLTLILTQVQGLSPGVAGLVVTATTGLQALGGLVAGRWGDRVGRRNVLVGFLGTSGLLLGSVGFAPGSRWALGAMIASGFFLGAMRPLLAALVADLTDRPLRRAAFSLSYLGVNLGVAVGPLLAGWLFQHALGWMFWLDALSTALALGLVVRFVPRTTSPPGDQASLGPSALRVFVRHPVLFPLSLLVLLYNVVYSQMIFTLSLQMVALFGVQGPPLYGVVWGVNALAVVALTPLVLRLTRGTTNLRSMAWGLGLFAVGTAVFLGRPTVPWVLGSVLLWTTGEVLFSVHFGDLVTSHSPEHLRGRLQALIGFVAGGGFVVSPLLSGLVVQTWGLEGVWAAATGLAVGVGIGFFVLDRSLDKGVLPG